MRSELSSIYRALDANFNRAGEALRVLEDIVRFQYDSPSLTESLKNLRHGLTQLRVALGDATMAGFRDTQSDVGTALTTEGENIRSGTQQIIAANCRRFAESIRVIEELCKLPELQGSENAESLRYRFYTVEKDLISLTAKDKLADVTLMVIFSPMVHGVQPQEFISNFAGLRGIAIQLSERNVTDGKLLEIARETVISCQENDIPIIIGDRPDICLLAGADGVHLGSAGMHPAEARVLIGSSCIIGLSTHSEADIGGLSDQVDYISAGPVFPASSKKSSSSSGLSFVAYATERLSMPVFAIGGICLDNLHCLADAGVRRVAVSASKCGPDNPRSTAVAMLEMLGR